jgi:hypothetical protein
MDINTFWNASIHAQPDAPLALSLFRMQQIMELTKQGKGVSWKIQKLFYVTMGKMDCN